MCLGTSSVNFLSNLHKKAMVFCGDEAAHVSDNGYVKRNSQFFSHFISQDWGRERSQVYTIVKDSKTPIRFPIWPEQIHSGGCRCPQPASRIVTYPGFHNPAIQTASWSSGLIVLTRMAVSNAHRYTLGFSPTEHHSRKQSDVTVHSIIVSFA